MILYTPLTQFYYLDTHWHANLPLREGIQIVAKRSQELVAMVNDFRYLAIPVAISTIIGADNHWNLRL